MASQRLRASVPTLLTVLVLLGGAVAAGSVSAGDGKITICHHPGDEARTLEVSRQAWSAHEGHGDHEGPCEEAGSAAADAAAREVRRAAFSTGIHADGDLDGDAAFKIDVSVQEADAQGVELDLIVHGDGEWRVWSRDAACSFVAERRVQCEVGKMPEGAEATVYIHWDADPQVCREPSVTVTAMADNADTHVEKASTHAGACSLYRRG